MRQHEILVGENLDGWAPGDDAPVVHDQSVPAYLHDQFKVVSGDDLGVLERQQVPNQAAPGARIEIG